MRSIFVNTFRTYSFRIKLMRDLKDFPDVINILKKDDYKSWKNERKRLTKALGPLLLSLNETEISSIYGLWENDFRLRVNETSQIEQMSCLLVISILYYFRRSLEQMKHLFSSVQHLAISQNRVIVKTFCKYVNFLIMESDDNGKEYLVNELVNLIRMIVPEKSFPSQASQNSNSKQANLSYQQNINSNISVFHHESYQQNVSQYTHQNETNATALSGSNSSSSASSSSSNQQAYFQTLFPNTKNEKYYFNAFSLILQVAKVSTTLFLNFSLNHISDIIVAICSSDKELSILASKIFEFHLRCLPDDLALQLSQEKYHLSLQTLKQKQIKLIIGPILLIQVIYSVFPQVIDVDDIFDCMEQNLSKLPPDVTYIWYMLFSKIARTNPSNFTMEISQTIFRNIQKNITSANANLLFLAQQVKYFLLKLGAQTIPYELTIDILKAINKKVILYSDDLDDFSSEEKEKNLQITDIVYEALRILLEKFPRKKLDQIFFINIPPTKEIIKVLELQSFILPHVSSKLQECTAEGIAHDPSPRKLLFAISILKTFGIFLFKTKKSVLEQLLLIARSNQESIRRKAINAISKLNDKLSMDLIISFALYDPSKTIRLKCLQIVKQMNPINIDDPKFLLPLIVDQSFKVRKESIPIIGKLYNANPLLMDSDLFYYIDSFISNYIPLLKPPKICKACIILQTLIENFPKICSMLAPKIIWLCMSMLLEGQSIKNYNDAIANKEDILQSSDLSLYKIENVHFEHPTEGKGMHWRKIFLLENEQILESQYSALFKILHLLAEQVLPFILQVGPVFIKFLTENHTNTLYFSAINALIHITICSKCKFKITSVFPDLFSALLSLLSSKKTSNNVCISILKLLGTIGATQMSTSSIIKPPHESIIPHFDSENSFSFSNPSFFVDFTLHLLVPFLKKTASPIAFSAITSIVARGKELAHPYLEQILHEFKRVLDSETDLGKMFKELEVIVLYCGWHVSKYIDQFTEILKKNILSEECLNLCITLSFELKNSFSSVMYYLFPIVLSNFDIKDNNIIKRLLKLGAFGVLFQGQSMGDLLQSVSINFFSKRNPSPEKRVNYALKLFTMLVQHYQSDFYNAEIALLCFRQLKWRQNPEVFELLMNLCLFGGLDVDYADQEVKFANSTMPHLQDIKNHLLFGRPIIEQVLFVKNRQPHINTERIMKSLLQLPVPQAESIFHNCIIPFHNEMEEWLQKLADKTVLNSPNIFIRSCCDLILQFPDFKKSLFPISFLSCWQITPLEVRQEFSQIIEAAIVSFDINKIGPTLPYLANILDRAGVPFMIPDTILSVASNSAALSLYQLERSLSGHKITSTLFDRLLALNTRLGRLDTARGLLKNVSKEIANIESGRWYEQLGEWEKALSIYKSHRHPKVGSLVRCYANLEQWDNVRQLSSAFQSMNREEKISSAKWFAYAFFNSKQLDEIEKYIGYLEQQDDYLSIIISSFYYIQCQKYDVAKAAINRGFSALVKDKSVFSGADANLASKYLSAAQHFVELQECIDAKTSSQQFSPVMWENRLKNYTEDTDAWTKLIDIRLLVLPPTDHVKSCIKLISVLRKERKWRIIESYSNRLNSVEHYPIAILERIKIQWASGQKSEAIKMIQDLSEALMCQTEDDFNSIIQKKDSSRALNVLLNKFLSSQDVSLDKTLLVQRFQEYIKDIGSDNLLKSKVLKLNASWNYTLYKTDSSSNISLSTIINIFEKCLQLNSEDSKIWAGWAYACSRALYHNEGTRLIYAENAIKGFLNASNLEQQSSLQYLCQIFSIITRYCDDFILPEDITKQITSLSPHLIQQIIPQIIIHITNPAVSIKKLVESIITKFSEQHFEAVVYPLNVISSLPSKEQSEIAKEMMIKLSVNNIDIYRDATLLFTNLHKAAVCWCERWINTLTSAYKAQNNKEHCLSILEKQFREDHDSTLCEFDESLRHSMKNTLSRAFSVFKQAKKMKDFNQNILWETLSVLTRELQAKINSIDSIILNKISTEIATKKGFNLSVPGMYDVIKESPKLNYIEPRLELLSTQTHPRLIYMWDETCIRRKFLLKGNDDLRLDQRIMQFFSLINSLLKSNRYTRRFGVSISMYAIVPFFPDAGLISWVTGADTVKQIVNDYRIQRNRQIDIEQTISHEYTNSNVISLSALQRLELFDLIASHTTADELRESIWMHAEFPALWCEHTRNFTNSTALMSLGGYIIGLGDRHLSNIMVQIHTGSVIHIDFGESFESASRRSNLPEKVPFRMTRLFVNALEGCSVNGIFRKSCEDFLYLLRENISPVIAQLEVFVHEPIFSVRSENTDQHKIISRVFQKLTGADFEYDDNDGKEMSVPKQIQTLIAVATDKQRYCRHFIGWQPTF